MNFDMVVQAEKRFRRFKTIVEIPDTAKLLIANCMMIELYVLIQQESNSSFYQIKNTSKQQSSSKSIMNDIKLRNI